MGSQVTPSWGLLQAPRFLSLRRGQKELPETLHFSTHQSFLLVRDVSYSQMSHHEEERSSFCLHTGPRVPYNRTKGSISQISVKLIITLQYPHKSIC